MNADELEAIKAAKAQQSSSGSSGAAANEGGQTQQRDAEETRREILATLLEPEARERRVWLQCILCSVVTGLIRLFYGKMIDFGYSASLAKCLASR